MYAGIRDFNAIIYVCSDSQKRDYLCVNSNIMDPYYLGGYFLIKNKTFGWSPDTNGIVQSCSSCINTQVFDYWCWSPSNDRLTENDKTDLGLDAGKIRAIQAWTVNKYKHGELRWGRVFSDLETVQVFNNLFFAYQDDLHIQAIYLSEQDTQSLITDFDHEEVNGGRFSIWHILRERIREVPDSDEELLGYDLIGMDIGGSFHSFHCHGISGIYEELAKQFGLTLNQYGLFSHIPNPQSILSYLNSRTARVEPVPWYIAKTKRIKTAHP